MNKASSATYLLIHGSWHSGQCWDRVVPLLESAGHRVLAPSLIGHGDQVHLLNREVGLDTQVDGIVQIILDADLSDVVLVGHSFAGMIISSVANQIPERIAHLVYVDALDPVDGECAVDVLPGIFQPMIDRAAASDTDWLMPPPPAMPLPFGLFGVTDPEDIAWLQVTLSGQPVRCWQQAIRLDNPARNTIPRTHIHCAAHPRAGARRTVPAVQPNGSPSRVWELPTGHDCMITMPNELAELLLNVRNDSEQMEPSL
jgi:pimeloyl-ACP methyl ester carboxylesterase